ncbi:coiled-coil-helix-coiled-coil-helix domain-containing protein 5 isoform X1 [Rana temporaria]|uniref:coiled-coil-helix-coiled-coil-helix domain-containing protein 5 isoform X1 n=2 Tax=Rana temporaria TaxID=8407 RepID=UPI001AAC90B0|nr:coiled-coil-helix-coiled-coil-helix domain-containing protein 5 isoform X1 [Rana temporaria]XP_040202301.1 coiled-coil-helix-coiled-coil-helix domain-containing protein 5 isoform X1 [Rana temporaria]
MQAAMEVTAKYCRNELDEYGQCVTNKPGTWHHDCYALKVKVALCTSSHPIIQKIRSQCVEPFTAFEQCLKLNPTAVEKCSPHVADFLKCAESVKVTE